MLIRWSNLIRYCVQLSVYLSLFWNKDLIHEICGEMTLPAEESYFLRLAAIEAIRIFLPFLPWINYSVTFVLKLVLIVYEVSHRLRYFLTLFLLELLIISIAVGSSFLRKDGIQRAIECILQDGIQRISLTYAMTQTFCPAMFQYYFIGNILCFALTQIELECHECKRIMLFTSQNVYKVFAFGIGYYIAFVILKGGGLINFVYGAIVVKIMHFGITLYGNHKYKEAYIFFILSTLAISFENVYI